VRITGIAGALVLNAAALMLMLAPPAPPAPAPARAPTLQGEWFEPRPLPPPPPPPLVPVRTLPAPPQAAPAPRQVARPEPAPPVRAAANPAPVPTPVPLPAETPFDAGDPGGTGTGPASGLQLAYAEASLPPYPPSALRAGHQGTVVLQVLVDVDGRPLRVEVDTGSGYRELDDAARRHVLRRWRFQPAMRDGQPVQAIGLVPITFSLDRG